MEERYLLDDGCEVDFALGQVVHGNLAVDLTRNELSFIETLIEASLHERVATYPVISQNVWDEDHGSIIDHKQSIKDVACSVRRKVGGDIIGNKRGLGYFLRTTPRPIEKNQSCYEFWQESDVEECKGVPHLLHMRTGIRYSLPEGNSHFGQNEEFEGGSKGKFRISQIFTEFIRNKHELLAIDKKSKRGVYIDGARVTPFLPQLVPPGSIITIDGEEFLYVAGGA